MLHQAVECNKGEQENNVIHPLPRITYHENRHPADQYHRHRYTADKEHAGIGHIKESIPLWGITPQTVSLFLDHASEEVHAVSFISPDPMKEALADGFEVEYLAEYRLTGNIDLSQLLRKLEHDVKEKDYKGAGCHVRNPRTNPLPRTCHGSASAAGLPSRAGQAVTGTTGIGKEGLPDKSTGNQKEKQHRAGPRHIDKPRNQEAGDENQVVQIVFPFSGKIPQHAPGNTHIQHMGCKIRG